MNLPGKACLVLCLLSAAGCIPSIGSLPEAARMTVPADWYEPHTHTAALAADWWMQPGDPVLDGLVADALAQNADLAMASARLAQAQALEHDARSALLPTLDGSAPISRSKSLNAFGTAVNNRVEQPAFQASYEIDVFGKNRHTWRSGKMNTLAAAAEARTVRISVTAATVRGYITLRALDARLQLLQQTLQSRKKALDIARDKARTGYTSQLDLNQAESEYAAVLQQIPAIEAAVGRQEHALSVLTGKMPGQIKRGKRLNELKFAGVPDLLPSEMMERRPDIVQAAYRLAASDESLRAARARFFPSVRISASLGRLFTTAAIEEPVTLWSVGGSILAPIFEGGKLKAGFDNASAKRDEAAWAYRKVVLNAFQEVEDRLTDSFHLQQQAAALDMQQQALAESLRHADARYRAGYSAYLEVLDSQRNLLNAENSVILCRADYLTAVVGLYQALGGGMLPENVPETASALGASAVP